MGAFTDPRLPGKVYKTERGLKLGLEALERRERGSQAPQQRVKQAEVYIQPQPPIQVAQPGVYPVYAQPFSGYSAPPEPQPTYIRNLHSSPARLRIGDSNYRLSPRGMRGDATKLTAAEAQSSEFQQNENLLFEVIDQATFVRVAQQQTTNQRVVHPAMEGLVNENGDAMSSVVVEQEFHERGITVGTIEQKGPGNYSEKSSVVQRAVAPAHAALPGTIDRTVENQQSEMARLMAADQVARSNAEGPEAGLAGFQVRRPLDPLVQTRHDDGQMNPTDRTPGTPVSGDLAYRRRTDV
jgi:hypothetical protein